jgi:hypothetical protein
VIKVIDEKFKEVIVNPIKDIIASIDLGFKKEILGADNTKKKIHLKTIQIQIEDEEAVKWYRWYR